MADKITVHADKLNPVARVYQEAGTFVDAIALTEPWPLEILQEG